MQAQIILSVITAVSTAAIALAGLLIARRQAFTSEEKLRLDLYQRRFDVYSRAIDFYQALELWKGSDEDRAHHRLFIKAKLESAFLFPPKSGISRSLEDMNVNAFKLMGFKEHGKELSADPPTFIEFYGKAMDGISKFELGVADLQQKMAPYLNFHLAGGDLPPTRKASTR